MTPKLTVNFGARFDQVKAFIDERQLSPRLNIAYQMTTDTATQAILAISRRRHRSLRRNRVSTFTAIQPIRHPLRYPITSSQSAPTTMILG